MVAKRACKRLAALRDEQLSHPRIGQRIDHHDVGLVNPRFRESSLDTLGGRSRHLSLARSGVKRFDLPKLLE